MMKYKYGNLPSEQIHKYKISIRKSIHWLLLYKEQNYEHLNEYFDALLFRINGYNSLFNEPPEIITLISTLEAARLESLKPDCDFKKYRKAILDAQGIVNRIKECD